MSKTFKTGYKFAGDSAGAVRATRAVRSELDKLTASQKRQRTASVGGGKSLVAMTGAATAFAAVAGAAVGTIGSFAKSIADEGDRVQKLSLQLGTSTEFLSGMSHAAELSGTSMDALGKGIKKMSKVVADAEAGLSTYTRAFDRIGISVEDIRRLSPEDQFYAIADAIAGTEDQTLKMAAAQDIFGARMSELIPLLNQGSDGMKEAQEEAERLGLVMSKEFADASAQFNDDLTRSKGVLTGIKRQIGEGLLPEMSALMQSFVDSAKASETWQSVGTFMGNVVRGLVAGFITVKTVIEITAKAFLAVGAVIVNTLQAIAAPIWEFSKSVGAAFEALISGDFSGAAEAMSGLGNRIAESFSGNMEEVKLALKEFGRDGVNTIEKAIEKVNDVLTRTAKVTQPAANGIKEAAEAAAKAAEEAAKAAKAFQSLADRLDPLSKLQRQFTVEQAILTAKIAEGGDGVAYYEMLLAALREEYADAARAAVGFGNDATKAAAKAKDAAEKTAETAGVLADDIVAVFQRGAERLDDLFSDLWKGLFSGAGDAMDKIKDFFRNWLAEMAHAAITRPIVVSITGAMGLTGSVASASTAGTVGNVAAGGSALSSGLSLTSLLGGNSIGAGLAGTGLGAFQYAGQVSNVAALGGAAIAGIAGHLLAPDTYADLGGAVGAGLGAYLAAGTWIAGPIGTAIGAVIGIAAGALLKKRAPQIYGSGSAGALDPDGDVRNKGLNASDLGGFYLGGGQGGVGEFRDAAITALQDFDNAVASILTESQLEDATDALSSWFIKLDKKAITVENLIDSRWDLVLGVISDEIRSFVTEVSGLEDQVERLQMANIAQGLIDAAPDLFEGRTFREFVVVAQAMQSEGEELTTTFQRLMDTVVQITQLRTLVDRFASSDLVADFESLMATQTATLRDQVNAIGDQIRTLRDGFTGSFDDLQQLSTLVAGRYEAEIAYLAQIDQVVASISAGSVGLREQIERDLYGDEAFYGRVKGRAESLAAGLGSLTDPSQIAATVAEIQRLTNIAYGLTPSDTRAAVGSEFLAFLDEVEGYALDRVGDARDTFLSDSAGIRSFVGEMAAGFGDPLEIAASAQEGAAEALRLAGVAIESNVEEIPNAIREGFSDVTITPSFNISVHVDAATGSARAVVNA